MPIRSVTPRQAKAARAVLGLSVAKVAKRAGISDSSVRRVEDPAIGAATLDLKVRLQEFYESAGIEFMAHGEVRGVHWREPAAG
jgi:hypothetical protein